MDHYDETTRTHNGITITVRWYYDTDMGAPWKEHDGHGDVSEWTERDKAPGELVLKSDRYRKLYYDFAGAVRKAREEGWDAEPFNKGQETKGEQAEKAARADFEYLRAWCNDEWHWCGYTVKIDGYDYDESLWGIESTEQDQVEEGAFADAIKWLENEQREEVDAACRDVVTV
jgi:hypothetical protein